MTTRSERREAADQLMAGLSQALRDGDMEAAYNFLALLAVYGPDAADVILAAIDARARELDGAAAGGER